MIEDVKVLLGDAAANFTDAQIGLALKMATAEIEGYCHRKLDLELEIAATQIAVIKLNRIHTEGLASQSFSGVSENYTDTYPSGLQALLDRKRKMKVI